MEGEQQIQYGATLQTGTACGVPSSGSNIIIDDVANYPVLDEDFTTGSLNLQGSSKLDLGGHSLTFNGPVSGSTTFKGSSVSDIIINSGVNAGTLNFEVGSQIIKDLTLNSGAEATIGTPLSITAGTSPGTLTVSTGAHLTLNDSLTLKSDIDGSARAGSTDGTITGNVTVERYIHQILIVHGDCYLFLHKLHRRSIRHGRKARQEELT